MSDSNYLKMSDSNYLKSYEIIVLRCNGIISEEEQNALLKSIWGFPIYDTTSITDWYIENEKRMRRYLKI